MTGIIEQLKQSCDAGSGTASGRVSLIETHISWVLLCGESAYKLKKPVKLRFLDYSNLALREAACREELRLNRRLAPELYLDVVPVRGTDGAHFGGDGPLRDWAVRMQRFDQSLQLDRLLEAGGLSPEMLRRFALDLARFQDALPAAAPSSAYGQPDAVLAPALDNFVDLLKFAGPGEKAALDKLKRWTGKTHARCAPLMRRRRARGRVREGHGDLHLANLVLWNSRVIAFDCIEFDPALRWGDVMGDVAFLVMDLQRRGEHALAAAFLDAWLEASGDFESVGLLAWYIVYRALVRAKVAMLQRQQQAEASGPVASLNAVIAAYIALAQRWARHRRPTLVLMCGLSGSGKTRVSDRLIAVPVPVIRIRSDVERKRLHGLRAGQHSRSGLGSGLYDRRSGHRTYARLGRLARELLRNGVSVVVDATFLRRTEREHFGRIAARLGVNLRIVECVAPDAVLRQRITQRTGSGDASEATLAVLSAQQARAEPLDEGERRSTLRVDTARPLPDKAVFDRLFGGASVR